jgi:DNA-binding response OmpR family regulator
MTDGVLVVVEDDPGLLEGWKDLFELSGYQVHGFLSAGAALEAGHTLREADLPITDYHLGDRNGIELIRAVRRHNATLPAVILTGLKQEHVREAVVQQPDVALFFKPIGMQELEDHVAAVMSRRAAGRTG